MGPGFESLKLHQWPIGQVVKTAASHAVNIGSNPVRVTKKFHRVLTNSTACVNIGFVIRSQSAFDINDGASHPHELVLIVVRVHLFPSRTQKLSSSAPTILGGRLPGKIGNANTNIPL